MLTDEQIGRNLIAFRGEVSQKDLASSMRALGFRWSQATVWSIEKGERPLRLSEAEGLAQALGKSSVWLLTRTDAAADAVQWGLRVSRTYQKLHELIAEYQEARLQFTFALDRVPEEDVEPALAKLADSWVTMTPERVVADYRSIYDSSESQIASTAEAKVERSTVQTWLERFGESEFGEHQAEA